MELPNRGAICIVPDDSDFEIRRIFFQRYAIYFVVLETRIEVAFIQHMARKQLDRESLMADIGAILRFEKAIALIDEANSGDPHVDVLDGVEGPKELIYGKRMMGWVERLDPEASDALKIAARAQHIRRWEVARSEYPEGKAGYYQWRTYLYGFHGDLAGAIMKDVGYDDDTIAGMQQIMQKKNLRSNADTQTLEDAAALVFLENHVVDFAGRDDMDESKLIDILRKTWGKMSERGHAAAVELVLPESAAALVQKALAT